MRLLTLAAGVPTSLEYALRRYSDDPLFRAQTNRATANLPDDPAEASRVVELARVWASASAAERNALRPWTVQDGQIVPMLDPYQPPRATIPDTCWEHWTDWQTHLGRCAGTVILRPTLLLQKAASAIIFPAAGASAEDLESVMDQWASLAPMVQIPSFFPQLFSVVDALGYSVAVTQEVAVMPTAEAVLLPRALPDGFTVRPVTTPEDVARYAAVTAQAYHASYGADPASPLITAEAFGSPNVRGWIVYDASDRPVRVISGFIAAGVVGAHAGAAVPEIRGMHFSEVLLSLVAEWGLSRGCDVLTGAAMPQASPILKRIGAMIVAKWFTFRREV